MEPPIKTENEEKIMARLLRKRVSNTRYRERHREVVRARKRAYKKRPRVRVIEKLYKRMAQLLDSKMSCRKDHPLVGCPAVYFKQWIEAKFSGDMSWDNHGTVWEIDHIVPCSMFDVMTAEGALACFNYRNLQPLLKHENRYKSHKLNASAILAGPGHKGMAREIGASMAVLQ